MSVASMTFNAPDWHTDLRIYMVQYALQLFGIENFHTSASDYDRYFAC